MASRVTDGIYNISGQEELYYIDIIKEVRRITGARAVIVNIPSGVFEALLRVWNLFDANPPFTTQQLDALRADDEFEVIDWPDMFNVYCTPFKTAMAMTFEG